MAVGAREIMYRVKPNERDVRLGYDGDCDSWCHRPEALSGLGCGFPASRTISFVWAEMGVNVMRRAKRRVTNVRARMVFLTEYV